MTEYSIKNLYNKPSLFIDGKPVPPVIYALSDIPGSNSNTKQAQENIENFAKAGINLVGCDANLCSGWRRVTPFDPEPVSAEILSVLDANPNAKILLRLHVNAPYWWHRDHPDECVIYRNPDGDKPGIDDGEPDRLIRNDSNEHMRVSYASKLWIKEACEKIRLLLEHIKGMPHGESLMAVQIAYGQNGEWHQWGTDVSKPMVEHFKEYLKNKYQTNENLQKAWNNESVTFETAEFRPEPYREGNDGYYRDPQKQQDTIDSQESFQLAAPEAILEFCKAVKSVMPNVLCGAFYGYYIGIGTDIMPINGHLKVDMLYKSEGLLDFLCGPFCYLDNRFPNGVPVQRALVESNRLRNMLWLTEMDQAPEGTSLFVGGNTGKMDKTLAQLKRNTLQLLLAGEGFWYYDHRLVWSVDTDYGYNNLVYHIYRNSGWWNTPALMSEIAKIQKLAEKINEKEYKPEADILIVYATDSYYYKAQTCEADKSVRAKHKRNIHELISYNLHESLSRCGVVFDCIYEHELGICDIDRYKCVIFANMNMITPEKLKEIKEITKDKMTVYLEAHGYCDGKTISLENISASTGMNIVKNPGAKSISLVGSDEILAEVPKDYTPVFAIEDKNAEILAVYDNGKAAAAKVGNEVFVALPTLLKPLAQKIVELSGAHKWVDSGDPVIAGHGYVAINCQGGGKRIVHLKNGKNIEIETTEIHGAHVIRDKIIEVDTSGYDTIVLDVESGERAL